MEDGDARTAIICLEARYLALRDVVVRLLAYQAEEASDPERPLGKVSARKRRLTRIARGWQSHMQMDEMTLAEFKRIISGARHAAGVGGADRPRRRSVSTVRRRDRDGAL